MLPYPCPQASPAFRRGFGCLKPHRKGLGYQASTGFSSRFRPHRKALGDEANVSHCNTSLFPVVPPVVTTPPGPPVSVAVGGNVTLACEVDGSPPPFITWRKDLQPLPADPRYSISSKDGVGTLTIRVRCSPDSQTHPSHMKKISFLLSS